MRGIKQKNTLPEKVVRSYLHVAGFRFRLHKKGIPGTPDLWLNKYNAAIFVNGCYWLRHQGCKYASTPAENTGAWEKKFALNVARDELNLADLARQGIRVLVIWDCALKTIESRSHALPKIVNWLKSKSRYREIPSSRQRHPAAYRQC